MGGRHIFREVKDLLRLEPLSCQTGTYELKNKQYEAKKDRGQIVQEGIKRKSPLAMKLTGS